MKNALTPRHLLIYTCLKKSSVTDSEGALLPSRGMAALPRVEVFGKGPGACEGGGIQHPKGAAREF